MKKIINIYISIIGIMIITMIAFTGCTSVPVSTPQTTVEEKGADLKIITTNQLLYFMIKDITKDKNNVEYMFNDEKDQWDFQYSEDSLNNISSKDLFIYMGADFEPWITSYVSKLNKSRVRIVDVSRGASIIPYESEVKYNETTIKYNPYYWMNQGNYITALHNITSELQENDPVNRDFYNKNFNDYIKTLDEYNKSFKQVSDELKKYTFLVSGDKLDYYLKDNNLNYLKVPADLMPTDMDKFYSKINTSLTDTKGVFFLYCDDSDLVKNDAIIKKYNLKCVNLIDYKRGSKYLDFLNYDLQNLKAALGITGQ